MKEKGMELSLFLCAQLRGTFSLPWGCLEQAWKGGKVYLLRRQGALDERPSPSPPPHRHQTWPWSGVKPQNKQMFPLPNWDSQVQAFCLFCFGVFGGWGMGVGIVSLGNLAETKEFRYPTGEAQVSSQQVLTQRKTQVHTGKQNWQ